MISRSVFQTWNWILSRIPVPQIIIPKNTTTSSKIVRDLLLGDLSVFSQPATLVLRPQIPTRDNSTL